MSVLIYQSEKKEYTFRTTKGDIGVSPGDFSIIEEHAPDQLDFVKKEWTDEVIENYRKQSIIDKEV